MRGQGGVDQTDFGLNQFSVCILFIYKSIRVARAKRVYAVEIVLRTAIPEVAEVQHGIDHSRRVAWFNTARVGTFHIKTIRISQVLGQIDWEAGNNVTEITTGHALRGYDVVAGA